MSTPAAPLTQAQNPWPGLFWYTEEQAHLFFGRQAEIEELLRLIQRDTLTILFGRSGLGKTSLLRAGVFPRLRQAGCFPVVLRLDYSPQTASPVEQVKALTEAAARASGIDIESAQNTPQPETLWEYFHRVRFWGPRNDRLTPVLVFDQFEEIFTVGSRRQEEADILDQLADLAENRIPAIVQQRVEASGERQSGEGGTPNYKIVLSLREDFVWRLDTLRPILPAIMRNRFALGPLDAARGLEIIRSAGKEWVTDEVAQDIIEAVISSRRGESLSNAEEEVEPAYLNVMCNELFERMVTTGQTHITRELVAAEKGGILESLYERSLSGLDDSVRLFVEEHLVTPAGFRATIARRGSAARTHLRCRSAEAGGPAAAALRRPPGHATCGAGARSAHRAGREKPETPRTGAPAAQAPAGEDEGGDLGGAGARRDRRDGALLACLRAPEYFLLRDVHEAKWHL